MNCTFCGHRIHDDACTPTITTHVGKEPTETPCPCTKRTN